MMKTQEQTLTRHPVKWALYLAATLMLSPCLAQAQSQEVSDNNSTLRHNVREPFELSGIPSSPVQFPDTIEWIVDGRRILVYPSIPGNSVDVEHRHPGLHVAPNQIHVQGPLFGYAASDVTIGIVYTVTGGAPGSGESRISEKLDIRNKSSTPLPLGAITGLGWLPDPSAPHNAGIEIPDLTGLNVTGTTMAFIQGDILNGTPRPLITDTPYGPVTVLPASSFTGFNPFLQRNITLQPGATLTIVTELNVGAPRPSTSPDANSGTSSGTTPATPDGGSPMISEPTTPQTPETSGGPDPRPTDGALQDPWKKMHHRKDGENSTHSAH